MLRVSRRWISQRLKLIYLGGRLGTRRNLRVRLRWPRRSRRWRFRHSQRWYRSLRSPKLKKWNGRKWILLTNWLMTPCLKRQIGKQMHQWEFGAIARVKVQIRKQKGRELRRPEMPTRGCMANCRQPRRSRRGKTPAARRQDLPTQATSSPPTNSTNQKHPSNPTSPRTGS